MFALVTGVQTCALPISVRNDAGAPCEGVEMRPGRVVGHEALEEQRRGDRPGKGRTARIAEIGDVGFEQVGITVPQRHPPQRVIAVGAARSEEHTSELQSLMRNSYAVFCLTKKNTNNTLIYSVTSYDC